MIARRPPGGSYTFACRPCDLTFRDGVDYSYCPSCGHDVEWLDESDEPVPTAMPEPKGTIERMTRYAFVAFIVAQTLFAVFDPGAFPYLAQILLFAQVIGLGLVALTFFVFRDVRNLIDHRTRIVHGLEHATIRVLEERGFTVHGGRTVKSEFRIVIANEDRNWERGDEYRAAATDAIRRVMAGEHALAYSIQCGTSYRVAIGLYALAIVAAGLLAGGLGAPVGITWAVTVGTALVARAVARRTGLAVQRWLTVSTDIEHASVTAIEQRAWPGRDAFYVTVAIAVQPSRRGGELISPSPLS